MEQPWYATLSRPIAGAPMAGGASTPALAAAVTNAGGLGFLAGGYLPPERLAADIAAVRARTPGRFGVNLFVPGDERADPCELARYRDSLAPRAASLGITLPDPPEVDDDWYAAKLALLVELAVPVVSFTFGCPSTQDLARLGAAGSSCIVTVTCADEAKVAADAGADVLCVQGSAAGGHRGTFHPRASTGESLVELLRLVRGAVDTPLIAAGGIATAGDVEAVLAAGAVAAQVGTALLRTPESGAHPAHKAALVDPTFATTTVTRAFSGRPARGLRNAFIDAFDAIAPAGYPQVHHLTRPLRAAYAQRNDPHGMALWAGTGHAQARDLPAAWIVELLTPTA